MRAEVLLALALLATSCGIKAAPRPPVAAQAAATSTTAGP